MPMAKGRLFAQRAIKIKNYLSRVEKADYSYSFVSGDFS